MALLAGCQNVATVGSLADGGIEARDAEGPRADLGDDGGPREDLGMPDAGEGDDGGAALDMTRPPACPGPWALMVAHGLEGTRVVRFTVGEDAPQRCADLWAEGTLTETALDVEAFDEGTIVVAGPDAVLGIDTNTDTVLWTIPGIAEAVDVQAFAVRTEPPWMGLAWWLESSRVGRITAASTTGATVDWEWPEQVVGAAPHQDPRYVYAPGRNNGLHVIEPFSGTIIETFDALAMPKPHVVPTRPPRLVSGHRGSLYVGTLSEPPALYARIIRDCMVREGAPMPGNPDEILVRCGDEQSSVSLVNIETGDERVLLGPDATDPSLHVSGLGVSF